MKKTAREKTSATPVKELAHFRYVLRQFLRFSEDAATRVGVPWQQHQLLLQIAGVEEGEDPTLAYLAERLAVRHNTLVELSQRCEEAGLLVRRNDARNRRLVVLRLTAAGKRLLEELSEDHVRELEELGPRLIEALQKVTPKVELPTYETMPRDEPYPDGLYHDETIG